jgi:hypothetical protein
MTYTFVGTPNENKMLIATFCLKFDLNRFFILKIFFNNANLYIVSKQMVGKAIWLNKEVMNCSEIITTEIIATVIKEIQLLLM